jgi:predicted choloylglycine hydrolase
MAENVKRQNVKRNACVLALGLLVFAVLLSGCGEKPPALAKVFPGADAVPGWRSEGRVEVFDRENLYDLVDGQAEAFFAYGFEQVAVRRYKNAEGAKLDVEVWQVAKPTDAYGLFTASIAGRAVAIGNDGDSDPGRRLAFWQDRTYVQVRARQEVDDEDLRGFAEAVSAALPEGGERPSLRDQLPPFGLVERSAIFFHEEISIQDRLWLGGQNVLGLGPETDGVLARYDVGGEPVQLLLVQYPDEEAAADGLAALAGGRARPEQRRRVGSLVAAGARGDLLDAVFGELDADEMAALSRPLNELRSLATLRKVDDHPLYVMNYYGDYGFGDSLQTGIGQSQWIQNGSEGKKNSKFDCWACSCFSALNEDGAPVFGRNFDWYAHPALLLFTDPPDGYASVSMVDISYLGFSSEEPSWADRRRLMEAPYLPFDGLNEHGLAIGMMAVPHGDGGGDPQKATIGSLQAIRLMLDYAGGVDQALSLLQKTNIDFSGGPPVHYLVSDPSGNSAVLEFTGGEMKVIRSEEPWQVATNFLISEVLPQGANASCERYNTAYKTLERTAGRISPEDAMTLLKEVSQPSTIWSTVYDMKSGSIRVAMGRKYDEVKEFRLEVKAER